MTNRDEELEKLKKWRTELERREAELLGEQKQEPDLISQHERDEKNSKVFDALTPAERVDLYTNHRDRWQELLKSKEAVGLRQLMRW